MADDAMWCLVMFDLPVETKKQRREAARFRHDLLDWGFIMVQFSVYAKYWPTGGQVRVIGVSDKQWASGLHFRNTKPQKSESAPEQLMIF